MKDISFVFKIVVIGDGRVGKTSLIQKFTQSTFKEDYIKTIGAQLSNFDKEINDDKIRLQFWDIAGQDTFHFLRPSFFKNSRAAIIVYSLEDNKLGQESFENIPNWYDEIKKYCGDIPILIFANKGDLVDISQLDESPITELVEENNLLGYRITSAKTGKGVTDAFNDIINKLYQKFKSLSNEL
ncbi:MAG: Rab family GTPase [Promethearchaeota archaeon]